MRIEANVNQVWNDSIQLQTSSMHIISFSVERPLVARFHSKLISLVPSIEMLISAANKESFDIHFKISF